MIGVLNKRLPDRQAIRTQDAQTPHLAQGALTGTIVTAGPRSQALTAAKATGDAELSSRHQQADNKRTAYSPAIRFFHADVQARRTPLCAHKARRKYMATMNGPTKRLSSTTAVTGRPELILISTHVLSAAPVHGLVIHHLVRGHHHHTKQSLPFGYHRDSNRQLGHASGPRRPSQLHQTYQQP